MSIELKPESSHASTKFGYLKTISTVVLVATLSALALWFKFNIFSLGSVDIQQPLPRLLFWLFLASLATSFLADLMNVYVSKRTFTLGQLISAILWAMLVTFLLSMNFANRLNPVLSINERYYIMMGIDSAINNAKTESIQQLCQNREQLRVRYGDLLGEGNSKCHLSRNPLSP